LFRYKITIEYDGTEFFGWQLQGCLPTIQLAVENALLSFYGREVRIFGSGRTDKGVHALGQVAHFNLEKEYPPYKICEALNHFLKPLPISIVSAEITDNNFHSRFSAVKRSYIYKVLNRPSPPSLDKNRVWHVVKPLNLDKMQEASHYLLGKHDFTSFCSTDCQAKSKIRTLDEITITKNHDAFEFFLESRSFLHNQVRIIVGSLVKVGKGEWEVDMIKEALEKKNRAAAGPTAPAHGLYFYKVDF
jgi:tRNA pseudouridine38-40 synthase